MDKDDHDDDTGDHSDVDHNDDAGDDDIGDEGGDDHRFFFPRPSATNPCVNKELEKEC